MKIIKDSRYFFLIFVFHYFNNSILKNADVIPVFKKKDQNNIENYCPISILLNLLKIYERCSTIKCVSTSIIYSQIGHVDSEKALAHNTIFLWWQKRTKGL